MRVAADRGMYARGVRRNVGKLRVENAAGGVIDAQGPSRERRTSVIIAMVNIACRGEASE